MEIEMKFGLWANPAREVLIVWTSPQNLDDDDGK